MRVGSYCAIDSVVLAPKIWIKRKEIGSMSQFFIFNEE